MRDVSSSYLAFHQTEVQSIKRLQESQKKTNTAPEAVVLDVHF